MALQPNLLPPPRLPTPPHGPGSLFPSAFFGENFREVYFARTCQKALALFRFLWKKAEHSGLFAPPTSTSSSFSPSTSGPFEPGRFRVRVFAQTRESFSFSFFFQVFFFFLFGFIPPYASTQRNTDFRSRYGGKIDPPTPLVSRFGFFYLFFVFLILSVTFRGNATIAHTLGIFPAVSYPNWLVSEFLFSRPTVVALFRASITAEPRNFVIKV